MRWSSDGFGVFERVGGVTGGGWEVVGRAFGVLSGAEGVIRGSCGFSRGLTSISGVLNFGSGHFTTPSTLLFTFSASFTPKPSSLL